MIDDEDATRSRADRSGESRSAHPGLLKRRPELQIWLIAGVFYAILVGMFLFVLVLIIRG
jgi:hypothetical protein